MNVSEEELLNFVMSFDKTSHSNAEKTKIMISSNNGVKGDI